MSAREYGPSWRLTVALIGLLIATTAGAHQPSESYLQLQRQGDDLSGHWDIGLTDLELAVGLDRDGDRKLTWGELRRQQAAIQRYALSRLEIQSGDSPCRLEAGDLSVSRHQTRNLARLALRGQCPQGERNSLRVVYQLLFDLDQSHQGIISLEMGEAEQLAVATAESREQVFSAEQAFAARLLTFLKLGMGHILEGPDHLLFLGTLILPLVLLRTGRRWSARNSFAGSAWQAARLVTLFTVAHSLTLILATTGLLPDTGGWVEPAIALSIILVALNNVYPVLNHGQPVIVFAFGLIHGLGFAGGLAEISSGGRIDLAALAGFNLGIEVVQLLLTALALPFLYWLAATRFYRRWLMPAGSLCIAALASLWLWQRLG